MSPRGHIGANGVPLGKKKWVKTEKITMPQNWNFWLPRPAVIDFWQKIEVTVMAPNHGADNLGSILGPMGSHWVQKMGQNRKKLPCPKIRIFGKIDRKKSKLRLWRQIARVHRWGFQKMGQNQKIEVTKLR